MQLLGTGKVWLADECVEFSSDKRFYLLGFLAYTGEWVSRDRLAYLFWPDVSTKVSKHRLRQLLKRVRALAWLSDLEVERSRVRWTVDADVRAFSHAIDEDDWELALELYRGPLLDGMTGDASSEFAEWLELERATLQNRWRAHLLQKAGRPGQDERNQPIVRHLATLLQTDEFDEEVLRAYMTSLFHSGRRTSAIAVYEEFAERVRDVLGLEPMPATQRLADSVRHAENEIVLAEIIKSENGSPVLSTAPPASTFVGRDVELASVMGMLVQPACRLLTLVGMGGVGKSRIAWQVAQAWDDPARFVRLDTLSSAAGIPGAIADSLGRPLRGRIDPLEQVIACIGERRMLLVLDNYEHVMEGVTIPSRLLQACPALSLLVTSRERLDLAEEWLYAVPGLSFPPRDVPLEEALEYEAVQLFKARTEQVRRSYRLNAEDLPHILEICRLVHGLPLGLELAAAWMGSVTAEAVAEETRSNADFLRRNGVGDRHESVRAVFENSWQLLKPEEQRALATLSVFRGGFTREAAKIVATASTAVLAALVDRSLLALLPDGRYDRHPLLYQYMSEKLARYDEEEASRRRHARYFLAMAESDDSSPRITRGGLELDALEAEHENLRAALRWGLATDHVLALRLAGALAGFWEVRGHLTEGCGWLAACLEAGTTAPAEIEARALVAHGRLLFLRGEKSEAGPRFSAALARWREAEDERGITNALNSLGGLAMEQGDFPKAEALYREALDSCLERDDQVGVANLLNNLAEVARIQQAYPRAERMYRECLALHRSLGNERGAAIALGNLGFVMRHQGELDQATTLLGESIVLKQRLKDEIGLAYCFAGLAGVLCDDARFLHAARLLGAADALIRNHSLELDVTDRADYEESVDLARSRLGDAVYSETAAEGRAMGVDRAVSYALELSRD